MRNDDSIATARKKWERVISIFEGIACTTYGYGLALRDAIKNWQEDKMESISKKAVGALRKDILELHRLLYGKPIQIKYLHAIKPERAEILNELWGISDKVYDVIPSLRDNLGCGAWDEVEWHAETTLKWLKVALKDLYRYLTDDETADPYN